MRGNAFLVVLAILVIAAGACDSRESRLERINSGHYSSMANEASWLGDGADTVIRIWEGQDLPHSEKGADSARTVEILVRRRLAVASPAVAGQSLSGFVFEVPTIGPGFVWEIVGGDLETAQSDIGWSASGEVMLRRVHLTGEPRLAVEPPENTKLLIRRTVLKYDPEVSCTSRRASSSPKVQFVRDWLNAACQELRSSSREHQMLLGS